jgi:DNA polymerase
LWLLDQKINDRGFAVDTELADAALQAVGEEKVILDARTSELTEGDVSAATKRDALLKHILEVYGVTLPDMQISTLERRLNDPELPEAVKELIGLRLIAAGTATTKYKTLLRCVCQDNRLRGTLQFCGANRTGRWAGRIFQPQNLPRPTMKNKEIDFGIRTLKAGAADLFYDNVKDLASNAIRGCIVAPEGKQLVVSDLSSIEGRVLAWLAGERWKIDAYYDYDMGQGYDMYVWAYANTFGVDPATVGKAERTLGKPIELALGYGGGVGAFITFANVYGIDLDSLVGLPIDKRIELEARSFWIWAVKNKKTHGLSEETFVVCDSIKRMWREKNAMIESFWKTLEHDVKSVLSGGFAEQRKFYKVDKKGSWLRIQLPSGRFLSYPGAKLDEENKISYLGVNQYSRKWGRLYTYGGKLAENVTQAAARDVLAVGMVNAEAARYEIILDVHDELLTETPDRPEFNHNHLSELMSKNPEWAKGLPLAAAGFESYRYRKD